MTKDEFELFDMINKVRINPNKFADLFFNKNEDTFHFLKKYSNTPPLIISKELVVAAYKQCDYLINKNNIFNSNINIKQRIEEYYYKELNYFGVNILYGKKKGYSIIRDMLNDQYILDKRNRINILNEQFNEIGLCIKKHNIYKYVCVIIFNK